ncbi:phosphotransferase (plasmid) [Prescottella equi]|uniref:phosphotransferase enzyme family protein n=1 Tax=Rhodococcus hoagii TaxID=43767 RepID=UPI0025765054|nr:phosphotransferase [Prescottella equi]WJJ14386.1 phosphotransferase [Prescottella equi]
MNSGDSAIAWVQADSGGVVVKWSRAAALFPKLEAAAQLLRALGEHGIPVAAPFATVDGRHRVSLDGPAGGLSVSVLPELTSAWLDIGDRSAVLAAGAALAEVHRALGDSQYELSLSPTPCVRGLAGSVDSWLAEGDRGLLQEASRRLADSRARLPALDDPPQLVHNDFRAANILTRGSRVVGVLDFDEVTIEHRVHDLAQPSVYLETLFRNWGPAPGYESVRPLTRAEAQWLDTLVLWHGIRAVPSDDKAGWAAAL